MNLELWCNHVSVPYFPVVGLIHPSCVKVDLLQVVSKSLKTGQRPGFDKSNRWSKNHPERLKNDYTTQTNNATVVYTKTKESLHAYIYTKQDTDSTKLIKKAQELGAQKIFTFAGVPDEMRTHVSHAFLGDVQANSGKFNNIRPINGGPSDLDALAGLDNGQELAGFAFLAAQIRQRSNLGPTLAYFSENKLAGAIGPLDIIQDMQGQNCLLPPYFGVLEKARGMGIGLKLWQAAMSYAAQQGAEYILVQAEDGAASVRFYERTGLKRLGLVYS